MSNLVYIATSIDGYIAREDGNIDWLMEVPNPGDSDYGFYEFLERIDAIVMGRKTFETATGFAEWIYPKPVFVLSHSLSGVPARLAGKAEIIKGALEQVIESLEHKGFQNLYIDGGKTIQSFLKADLIDELIITRIPVVLGSGIPLFGKLKTDLKFTHVETEIYDNTLVKSRYIRKR